MSFTFNSFNRLFIILISLYLIPLSVIVSSASIRSARQKQILLNNERFFSSDEDFHQQGILGCKYDADLCKVNEFCFDDHLFGQCWKNDEIRQDFLRLKPNSERLSTRKFQALKYTFHVLKYFNLSWKDREMQCIISEILFSPQQQGFDRYHLKLMYKYCFNERQFAIIQQKFHRSRRALDIIEQNYQSFPGRSGRFLTDLLIAVSDSNDERFFTLTNGDNSVEFDASPSKFNQSTLSKFHEETSNDKRINEMFDRPDKTAPPTGTKGSTSGYIVINRDFQSSDEANRLLAFIADINRWPLLIFVGANIDQHVLTYDISEDPKIVDISRVVSTIFDHQKAIEQQLDITIVDIGIGQPNSVSHLAIEQRDGSRLTLITWIICTLVFFFTSLILSFYCIARNERVRLKLMDGNFHPRDSTFGSPTYLCQSSIEEETTIEKDSVNPLMFTKGKIDNSNERDESSSSKDELSPVNFDISTGHLILSYIEDHLVHRQRLESEWEKLCLDERKNEHTASFSIALSELNTKKNRSPDCIPYDHARIQLADVDADDDNSDYINASPISDSSPKCKYIATQGPMANTTNAFWQMVWEQGSCVIVALARPIENGQTMYHHYWPIDGTKQFGDFEVNLVSEHSWSTDYLVRSFYLKNLQTMETRTVTQFHFLTWSEFDNVPSSKTLLDFRRKVNKSFHERSSTIVVHCNDGCGRTGVYILIDMVLNKIWKGTRELNIAATLEYLRDQRTKMVKSQKQFEFVFVAVAEELHQLLKN